MMKKLSAILLAATLTLTIGTTAAFAAGHGSHIHYVDANQDNICDYCDQNRLCADEDHDGICDYHSSEHFCQTGTGSYCTGSGHHGNHHQGNYQNCQIRTGGLLGGHLR